LTNDNNKIIAREDNYWPRKIRESIEIKIRKPDLNRDAGYHLPPVYNELLSADPLVGSADREA
jgi:hypothetical protein